MPGLYGLGANVTVNSSNTTGLYAVANVGNVYTGNISSSNTTGLYIGAGTPTFLNNAELLLLLLDNTGNVNFALDPTTNNSTIFSYFVGSTGSTYSNTNVAAFLPGYTGTLDNSTTIINLLANAGIQATSINVLNANLGAFQTYANATFSTGGGTSYGNANVAAFLPFNTANVAGAFFIGDGSKLTNLPASTFYSNANVAAYLPTYTGTLALSSTIIDLYANAAAQEIDIGTLFSNQTTLQGEIIAVNANVVAANVNIATINANLGAFETYVNATFSTSTYSNANVAAYLPIYTGTLANSSTIIDLYSNAAAQATSIDTLFANAGAQATSINTLFANAASQAVDIGTLFSNQTTLQGEITAVNANVVAANLNIATVNANLGAYQLYANANAASQAISIDTINANVAAANLSIAVLDANVGAFEIYANATFLTSSSAYSNVNVAAYLPTYTGSLANSSTIVDLYSNAATQATAIATVNANLGAYQTYANTTNDTTQANIGTLFLGNASTQANLGAYQTYANANIGTLFLGNTSTNANLGAFQTYVNASFSTSTYSNANVAAYLPTYTGTLALSSTIIDLYSNAATQAVAIGTLNANLGAYQQYANANIGTLFLGNVSTQSNLGAFQTYANATFGPGGSGFYSNANVAAYLPVYGGNILATVTTPLQPYIRSIGANNNNSATYVTGGNGIIITANAGAAYSNAGGIIIIAGNEQVKTSGTFYAESSSFTFQSHNGNNNGNDPSDQMRMTVPTAVYGQFQQTSTEFGANTFSVYDGNVYIGPRENNIPGSGILRVYNKVNVYNGGVLLDGNTITTVGFINSGGNVSAPYFIGDGSQLTNIPSSSGNTQIAQYLPSYTGNIGNVSMTTGTRNIYSGNVDIVANSAASFGGIIDLIALQTGISNSYKGQINLLASNVSINAVNSSAPTQTVLNGYTWVAGDTTFNPNPGPFANLFTVSQGNVSFINWNNAGGNRSNYGGYVFVSNNITAVGNVSAAYFIGDGSKLTGITGGTYGNTEVAAFLPTYTGTLALSSTIVGIQANIGTLFLGNASTNANLGAFQTFSNANAATQATSINTINANLGAFQNYANVTFIGNTQVLANLAANSTQTSAWSIPFGGNAARPGVPFGGMIRYNTDYNVPEWYSNVTAAWYSFSNPIAPTPPAAITMRYLVVAGGASGASRIGAGGGAGGLLTGNVTITSGTTYTITVGAGGAAVTSNPGRLGTNGGNSSISGSGLTTINSIGGGGGGAYIGSSASAGVSGGSGGGGTWSGNGGVNTPGSGTAGQGFAGGSGSSSPSFIAGGGGGGASAVGVSVTSTSGGTGGAGVVSNIMGANVTYGGGGGGCASTTSPVGQGGTGGGGAGSNGNNNATAGTNFLGGGGGGARNDSDTTNIVSGKGGDGVVIIRLANVNYSGSYTGSNVAINYSGGDTILKYSASGTYVG